ncbi:MAG: ankyrin repeat domain-containing protein, partial [Pseudomonadales bacterium]|nr:ankyrin repeat domain-containing protein [Pseudomonadales bacterium]
RGYTPLLLAVAGLRIETARAALELGANVEHRSREGNTALIIAASRSAPLVEILLSHGADPEARNDASNTALMIAAHADCLPCVRSLLDAGAKPGRRNSQGKQARDLTTDPVVLKLLQDRG